MEFRLLGPLEVVDDDGAPVEIPGTRLRMLLAVLLVHANEVVPVDRLSDALWLPLDKTRATSSRPANRGA